MRYPEESGRLTLDSKLMIRSCVEKEEGKSKIGASGNARRSKPQGQNPKDPQSPESKNTCNKYSSHTKNKS